MLQDEKFPEKIIRFISSWLSNRKCRVRINDEISYLVLLKAGVPQGSLLSPIIYIFYIQKMPTKSAEDFLTSFYADDTSYAASDNPHSKRKSFAGKALQEILLKLEKFCSKWRIGLNASKTNCILFQKGSLNLTRPNLYLKNELIKYEKNVKFLGITFD